MEKTQGKQQRAAWPLCLGAAAVLLVVWLVTLGSEIAGAAGFFGLLLAVLGVADLVFRAVRRQPLR
jgi:hypothetical protein